MDGVLTPGLLWPPTVWHWLILALVLLGVEMLLGTFDLLMVSIAAFLTTAFAAFGPAAFTGWEAQLTVFFGASIVLIILGRTVFTNLRTGGPGEPALNRRMHRMVGARGTVVDDFASGQGRVRLGDTEWLAEAIQGENLKAGAAIVVEGARSTVVLVRPAG